MSIHALSWALIYSYYCLPVSLLVLVFIKTFEFFKWIFLRLDLLLNLNPFGEKRITLSQGYFFSVMKRKRLERAFFSRISLRRI